jgi:uncharacterized protein (TIGR03086 family)
MEETSMTATPSTRWTTLDRAHVALVSVAEGVSPEHLDRPTPCSDWTVAQVLQHAAGDQLAYVAAITGQGGPTENPFTPSGTLAGTPAALVGPAVTAASAAFAGVDPDGTAPTPLPHGALPAAVAAGAAALDAGVHAWDVAVATGQASPLDDDVATELLAVARQIVEPLREYGAYAAVVETSDTDADDAPSAAVAELLRYLGRDPHWTQSA